MRVVIFALFFALALAETKINLEDIERDLLRSDKKSSSEKSSTATGKPEVVKPTYRINYQRGPGTSGYSRPQKLPNKYARSEDYQDIRYVTKSVDYKQSPKPIQYADYNEQSEPEVPKALTTIYATEQLYYRPEVPVGNHYQSVQQKKATEKYDKNYNKESLYVPMADFLSYYGGMGLSEATRNQAQSLLHRLGGDANQQIAIPIYMSSHEPIYSAPKVTYQIQPQYAPLASNYRQMTEAILPTRAPKSPTYYQGSSNHRQQEQPQAENYIQEQIVYAQEPLSYAPTSSSASHETTIYARPLTAQSNEEPSSHNNHYENLLRQEYVTYDDQMPTQYAISTGNYELTNQIYQQQQQSQPQHHDNSPEPPGGSYDLPRLPAQNFQANNRLSPTHNEIDDSHNAQNHLVQPSEPRSLLESYVPSHVIAAQDSERYRERPIKLEGGFVPSKIHYLQSHKKRKAQ